MAVYAVAEVHTVVLVDATRPATIKIDILLGQRWSDNQEGGCLSE